MQGFDEVEIGIIPDLAQVIPNNTQDKVKNMV